MILLFEVRGNTAAVWAATYSDVVESITSILQDRATDPAVAFWRKGLALEPLSEIEAIQFEQMARAYTADYFRAWNRANASLSAAAAERFAREVAVELLEHAGLMAYWMKVKN